MWAVWDPEAHCLGDKVPTNSHSRFLSHVCHVVDSGAARKLFGHPKTKNDTQARSITSSGLRREVQDSLSELEQLIEQQHRQV